MSWSSWFPRPQGARKPQIPRFVTPGTPASAHARQVLAHQNRGVRPRDEHRFCLGQVQSDRTQHEVASLGHAEHNQKHKHMPMVALENVPIAGSFGVVARAKEATLLGGPCAVGNQTRERGHH